jgi:hypothetical protein
MPKLRRREFFKTIPLAAAGTMACGLAQADATASSDNAPLGTVRESPRETPVAHECDLCVIGGSATGVAAAVAAARLGARVAIVELNGFFGGVATASLVNIWHSIKDLSGKQQIIGGLTTEIIERLQRRGAVLMRKLHFLLNTEMLKLELDQLVLEAGVRPFLHAMFVAPVVKDNCVTAAIIEDKSGRRAIRARHFIDASGDADLAMRMGLPVYRRDSLQPPTTCCILRELDGIRKKYPKFNLHTAVFDAKYPQAIRQGYAWSATVPGATGLEMLAGTRVFGADCSDADQLTQAELEGRRQVRSVCELLREHFMDGKGFPLAWLPAKIGIRETRHVHCLHTLTTDEILTGKRFPDAIGNGTYPIDVHSAHGAGITLRPLKDAPFYQIPLSALVPKGAKNVLIAGRSIDADEGAFGAVRVMVNCNQMGQAAGTAAWLALQSDVAVDALDTSKLRQTLKSQGAIIV